MNLDGKFIFPRGSIDFAAIRPMLFTSIGNILFMREIKHKEAVSTAKEAKKSEEMLIIFFFKTAFNLTLPPKFEDFITL